MAQSIISTAIIGFLPDLTSLATNWTDKVGFDRDTIGRSRETRMLEEKIRAAYQARGLRVNIAIWNMHIPEEHAFGCIIESGMYPMGRGGGFRVVVFQGDGWLKNNGARGFENWCCSGWEGTQRQNGNVIHFRAA